MYKDGNPFVHFQEPASAHFGCSNICKNYWTSPFPSKQNFRVCVLKWDPESSELVTRSRIDISHLVSSIPTEHIMQSIGQIETFDPYDKLYGLHSCNGTFTVMQCDNDGKLKNKYNFRLDKQQVLDIKFMYGCSIPTVVVLNQSIIGAYGRFDAHGSGYRYLLGDSAGILHLLVINHEIKLELKHLGETSIASTISYLNDDFVFVGSCYGDSQLVKLNLQPDAKGLYAEVLERYVNIGPIVDFCVVDLKCQGQGNVVSCSGAYKDSSLCVVCNGLGITKQAYVLCDGISGIWSLRSSINDIYDTYLVVSFYDGTKVSAMNCNNLLSGIEMEGFDSKLLALFCSEVTKSSVRLVSSSSKKLQHEWKPLDHNIVVATANVMQVLLETRHKLYLLEICDTTLKEVVHKDMEIRDKKESDSSDETSKEVSCKVYSSQVTDLHISPIVENLDKMTGCCGNMGLMCSCFLSPWSCSI